MPVIRLWTAEIQREFAHLWRLNYDHASRDLPEIKLVRSNDIVGFSVKLPQLEMLSLRKSLEQEVFLFWPNDPPKASRLLERVGLVQPVKRSEHF